MRKLREIAVLAGVAVMLASPAMAQLTISGGTTLDVSSDSQLGPAGAPVTLDGIIQFTQSLSTSRSFSIGSASNVGGVFVNPGFIVSPGATATLNGVISGDGLSFYSAVPISQGTGTLILAGANSFTGAVVIGNGTLAVSGGANLGATSNLIVFDGDTSGTLRFLANATISQQIYVAPESDTIANIDTNGNNVTLASPVTGQAGYEAAINKIGAGALTLTGNNMTTSTTVTNGTLALGTASLPAQMAGPVTVFSGASFVGNGSIATSSIEVDLVSGSGSGDTIVTNTGSTSVTGSIVVVTSSAAPAASCSTVNAGICAVFSNDSETLSGLVNSGTVAPLGATGKLSVAGSYTQNASGTLSIEVSPSGSGQLALTGTASLAGALNFLIDSGSYGKATDTFLTSSGITGGFSSITFTDLPPSLSASVNFTGTDGTITLTPAPIAAATIPSSNLGGLVNALNNAFANASGDLLADHDALLDLPAAQQQQALTQIRGIGHGAAPAAAAGLRQVSTGLVMGRAFSGSPSSVSGSDFASPIQLALSGAPEQIAALLDAAQTAQAAGSINRSQGAWVQGAGDWDDVKGDSAGPGSASAGGGIEAGYDRTIGDEVRLGGAFGYGRAYQTQSDTGATNRIDSYRLSAYGGWNRGPWSAAGSLGFALDEFTSGRSIDLGATDLLASAVYWGHEITASSEVDYAVPTKLGTLSPFLQLDFANQVEQPFTESGAGSLDLAEQRNALDSLQPELGLAFSRTFASGADTTVAPEFRLGVSHELMQVSSDSTAQLVGAGAGNAFTTEAVGADRTALDFGARVVVASAGRVDVYADWQARVSGHQVGQTLGAGARYSF